MTVGAGRDKSNHDDAMIITQLETAFQQVDFAAENPLLWERLWQRIQEGLKCHSPMESTDAPTEREKLSKFQEILADETMLHKMAGMKSIEEVRALLEGKGLILSTAELRDCCNAAAKEEDREEMGAEDLRRVAGGSRLPVNRKNLIEALKRLCFKP